MSNSITIKDLCKFAEEENKYWGDDEVTYLPLYFYRGYYTGSKRSLVTISRCSVEYDPHGQPCWVNLYPAKSEMGKWINHYDDLFPAESTIECSLCHAEQYYYCDGNYCPNCGAKMIGE